VQAGEKDVIRNPGKLQNNSERLRTPSGPLSGPEGSK
jgi:hypothetical protein